MKYSKRLNNSNTTIIIAIDYLLTTNDYLLTTNDYN